MILYDRRKSEKSRCENNEFRKRKLPSSISMDVTNDAHLESCIIFCRKDKFFLLTFFLIFFLVLTFAYS